MKNSIQSVFLAFVLLTVLLNGCAPAPTPKAPTPSESISEPPHEIYAGFTDDPSLPFAIVHKTGESLMLTQDVNSSTVTGAVWTSPDGDSVVIYADKNGKPTGVVVGEQVIFFSNYTANTVDLTIIKADGTSITAQSKLDNDILQKIKAFEPSPNSLISFSRPSLQREEFDQWFWMETGFYMFDVAVCTTGVLTVASGVGVAAAGIFAGLLANATILTLAKACTGALLGTVTRVGTILDIDVSGFQFLSDVKSVDDCVEELFKAQACVELLIPIAKKYEKAASTFVSSNPNYSGLQQGTFDFDRLNTSTPTPKPTATLRPPTDRPIPTITPQPISSPQGIQCGQYISINWTDSSGFGWGWFIFVTPNNVFGLPSSDSLPSEGNYYRIYDTAIDWTPVTYGDGTQTDGSITSFSAYESMSSLQNCQQTQQQPPAQPLTSAQQAQISNEVYFAALRQSPGYSNKNNDIDLLANVPAGDIVQILGGPEQADGLNWWNISWNGITGWMADHTGSGKTIMIFMP